MAPLVMPLEAPLARASPAPSSALGLFVAVLAVVGPAGARRPASRAAARRRWRARTRRLACGIGAGLVALLLSAGSVAGDRHRACSSAYWDQSPAAPASRSVGIARLEGLAAWTESLRDTIAGAIGLEQAIPATAVNAAPAIRPSLNLMVDRLRIREPLPGALIAFAEDLDDSSADVICAALLLNARLRGPGLRDVLTRWRSSTREELDMRRRIEASRKSIRRSVRIVLLIVLGMMGGLSVLNRHYVAALRLARRPARAGRHRGALPARPALAAQPGGPVEDRALPGLRAVAAERRRPSRSHGTAPSGAGMTLGAAHRRRSSGSASTP